MADENGFRHEPVLLERVLDLFAPVPGGAIADLTLGAGGHAEALLRSRDDLTVVGIDQDDEALAAAGRRLAPFGDRVVLRHARFDRLGEVLAEVHAVRPDLGPVVGVLADLGVSSPQLDRAERGFSYRLDAPLDMRMDRRHGPTAADLVNSLPADELARILRENADERFASRIARRIVEHRPVRTTGELADLVREAIPAAARRHGGHPAKRTFQALRIAVNDELGALERGLDQAIEALAPGGRMVVIAYHGGEDRIVKERFRTAATGGCTCPPGLPCVCGAQPTVELLKRGAWRPTETETAANPRAESARLRAVEKTGPAPVTNESTPS